MTQKAFCEQRSLSLPQFVYYQGRFKIGEKATSGKASFVPVRVPKHDKVTADTEMKLSLPNGFQIEVLLSC